MKPKYKHVTSVVVGLAILSTTHLFAVELEEVVVTAQKRSQDLQETPIAISVFDAEALAQQGITDIQDISEYTPNVQIAESPGGSTGATIGIRGSVTVNPAVTWEQTVGIYLDGVYISKNVGGIFDVAELNQIEVLRGPQGSLYGKNTVGGAVNLITRKPREEFSGEIKIGAGNYDSRSWGFSVDSGKLGDVFSFNLAYSKRDRDGFYDNLSPAGASEFKELDSEAGRFAARFDLSDALSIDYSYDWSEKDNTPTFGQFDSAFSPKPFDRRDEGALDGTIFDTSESTGHALHLTYQLSEDLTFKSITSYREMSFHDRNDFDGFPIIGFHAERDVEHDQTSQEFQLIGSTNNIDFVVGLFYFREESEAINPLIFGFGTIRNFYGVDATSIAAYGQLDWHATDKLTVTAGLRWSDEDKDFYIEHPDDFNFDGQPDIPRLKSDDSWNNVTPTLVITYDWNDDISTYAKYSNGWKAGGFNGEAATAAIAQNAYDEETVRSLELGLKSRFMDNRIQLNLAVFENKIDDLQLSEFLGAYSLITNAGEATIRGYELEVQAAITEGLRLNFNYGYLDAEYDSFVVGGVETKDTSLFPYTPDNTYSFGLSYSTSTPIGELSARLDYSHIDDQDVFHSPATAGPTTIKGYEILNARITLQEINIGGDRSLKFSVWGKNLTDEDYRMNGIPVANALGQFIGGINYFGDPRTYGLDVSFSF